MTGGTKWVSGLTSKPLATGQIEKELLTMFPNFAVHTLAISGNVMKEYPLLFPPENI